MKQDANTITAYIETLHANRHLIAAAYCQGGVVLNDENQRKIRQLIQNRVLIPYLEQNFRISPTLGRHLDEVFQKQRSYSVGANFGDLVNRLHKLIIESLTASIENRLEDQEDYAAEFDASVFELSSMIADELMGLRTITENQFANVTTMAEKQRQNEFYIQRAERIGETLALLEGEDLMSLLLNSVQIKPLLNVYQHQVLSRMAGWRSMHMDITALLKAFLYRLRQVEPNARKIRAMAYFLKKNPDYQPPESIDIHKLPKWSSRYGGIRFKTHPDLSAAKDKEFFEEIAESIPSAKTSFSRGRLSGSPVKEKSKELIRLIQPKPVQVAFQRYLKAACQAPAPLFAVPWKRQQPEFLELNDEAWLLYAVYSAEIMLKSRDIKKKEKGKNNNSLGSLGFDIKRHEALPLHNRSGNIVIEDLSIWKKS